MKPQVVRAGANAELGRQLLEAMRDAIRTDGCAAVGRPGAHIGLRRQGRPGGEHRRGLPRPVRLEQLDGVRADGDAAFGVGLGVLVDQRPTGDPDHTAGDPAPRQRPGRRRAT
jgi:hypothetical protein